MGRAKPLAAMFVVSVGSVMFLSACKEAEAPAHDATVTTTPAATATQAAITIDEPRSGDQVKIPMTVKGTASVFEGTVVIAVESADGSKTFCKTFATASDGAPGRGSFEAQIAFPPPLEGAAARVRVYSESAKDGSVQKLVSVPFTISSEQPPVIIDSPLCGDEVNSPATVTVSTAFEGELVVVIKDSSGTELARARQVMASSGRGTISQELDFSLSGGSENGTVEAFSSPREGTVESLFSVPVTLVP